MGEEGAHVTCARKDRNKCPGAGANCGSAGRLALHRGCTEQERKVAASRRRGLCFCPRPSPLQIAFGDAAEPTLAS